jgi:hypothetical protein
MSTLRPRPGFHFSCRWLPLLAALVVACGGVSENPPGSGDGGGSGSGSGSSGSGSGSSSGSSSSGSGSGGSGSGSGSSGGSSSGGQGKGCPESPPINGSPCANASQSCEYGGDQDLQCDTLAVCENGDWQTTSAPTDGLCPTSSPGTKGCPGSYAKVPVGESCTGNADCAYPQGRCACTTPLGGPVQLLDAGSSWVCEIPSTGCPEPRPQAGTPCSVEGETCDYGTCTLPGGTEMACTKGEWAVAFSACASLAGSH